MAKKTAPDGATAATAIADARQTYKLIVPVTDGEGSAVVSLTIVDPELRHRAQVERLKPASQTEATRAMISVLTGVPADVVGRIKYRDYLAIDRIIESMVSRGVKADIATDAERYAAGGSPDLDSTRTFKLIGAIATDAAPVSAVTAVEPDIDAGIAVERFKTEAEQSAAMIAKCTSLPIPVVMRMKLCDVLRLERWLNFFLNGGWAPPETQPQQTVSAMFADGVTSQ